MNVTNESDIKNQWDLLHANLPLLGHRNWIVIADAAYPQHASAAIETIVVDAEQIDAVREVLRAIAASNHVRANVYTDLELIHVNEADAPGVSAYRKQLDVALIGTTAVQIPHEEIIARLDKCAQVFRVLLFKTRMRIPYTSVFCELECGYWSAVAEERLRKTIQHDQNSLAADERELSTTSKEKDDENEQA